MGEIKTAVAKKSGTNTTIYEVVYVEVIDPSDINSGTLKVRTKDTIRLSLIHI